MIKGKLNNGFIYKKKKWTNLTFRISSFYVTFNYLYERISLYLTTMYMHMYYSNPSHNPACSYYNSNVIIYKPHVIIITHSLVAVNNIYVKKKKRACTMAVQQYGKRGSRQMNRRLIDIGEASPWARAAEGDWGRPHQGLICI